MVLTKSEELKLFYKKFFMIGLPLTLQQLVTSSLNFIDNLMIGRLGPEYLAAIGFANSVYRIVDLIIFGICSGMSVFISQYFGKNNFEHIKKIFSLMIRCSIAISLVFFIIVSLNSYKIIQIFSIDLKVLEIGSLYLKTVAYCYVFYAISSAIGYTLRAMGYTKYPMIAACIGVITNTFFNYCLIYGNMGFPALKEQGAAIATIIARIIEMFVIIFIVYKKDFDLKGKLNSYFNIPKKLIKEIISVSTPVLCTEMFWILGTISLSIAYAKLGTNQAAAMQIADIVGAISAILFMGISNASTVIIGNTIGSGKKDKAVFYSKQVLFIAISMSGLCFLIVQIIANFIVTLYKLPIDVHILSERTLRVYAIFVFFKMINWALLIGIFRAGGDTKVAFYLDILPLWLYGLPVAFIGAYYKIPIYYLVALAEFSEVIKLTLSLFRYKSLKWLKDLTTE